MKVKYMFIIKCILIVLMIAGFLIYAFHSRYECVDAYYKGKCLLEAGDYDAAVECFDVIPDYMNYKDISTLLHEYIDENHMICPNCGHVVEID